MRSVVARGVLLGIIWLAASSCATVPTGPLASGELRLLKMQAPETIQAGVPYEVLITFESDGLPEITRACFFWTGAIPREGPYCFRVDDVKPGSPGSFKVSLRTRNPRGYTLDGYAEYLHDGRTERSNEVSAGIYVRP